MEILERLERLKEEHRDARGELSYESHTCLQAAAIIQGLDDRVVKLEKARRSRFDHFFAAALHGILARSTAGDLMSHKSNLVNEARWIAEMCVQEPPP